MSFEAKPTAGIPRRMLDVVLAVPHGHPEEDRAALPVAERLNGLLEDAGYDTALIATKYSRKKSDGNRPESRGRPFRQAISEELERAGGARLFVDVHSFKPWSKRFHGKDVSILHTPGLQNLAFLKMYARLLRASAVQHDYRGFHVTVERAQKPNDVCEQARELGVEPDALMLVEHNDLDMPKAAGALYAPIHFGAIEALFLLRGWSR